MDYTVSASNWKLLTNHVRWLQTTKTIDCELSTVTQHVTQYYYFAVKPVFKVLNACRWLVSVRRLSLGIRFGWYILVLASLRCGYLFGVPVVVVRDHSEWQNKDDSILTKDMRALSQVAEALSPTGESQAFRGRHLATCGSCSNGSCSGDNGYCSRKTTMYTSIGDIDKKINEVCIWTWYWKCFGTAKLLIIQQDQKYFFCNQLGTAMASPGRGGLVWSCGVLPGKT